MLIASFTILATTDNFAFAHLHVQKAIDLKIQAPPPHTHTYVHSHVQLICCCYTITLLMYIHVQSYDITIEDHNQPMLLSRPKKREIRARGGDDSPLLLVPELCTRTGVYVCLLVGWWVRWCVCVCVLGGGDRGIERGRT